MKSILRFLISLSGDETRRKLHKYLIQDSLARKLRFLRNNGVKLDVIYDVGAYKGGWANFIHRKYGKAEIIMFEANAEFAGDLEKTGFRYFLGPLASSERELDFYSIGGTGDSYYREKTTVYDDVAPKKIRSTTLDKLIADNGLPLPDFIKIDTQGSEIDILKGADKALEHASLAYMECPILEYNVGAPTLAEYISYMRGRGFLPHDLFEIHTKRGVLIQIDIMFVRKDVLLRLFPDATEFYKEL